MRPARAALAVAFLAWLSVASSAAVRASEARPLVEVLEELRDRGLRLIYGSNTVVDEMTVSWPPSAEMPREILDEVLLPHGLSVQESEDGLLTVVRLEWGDVEGTVVDAKSGLAVAGAEVDLDLGERTTKTSGEGGFRFDRLSRGRHRIEVRRAGYVIHRGEISVLPGQVSSVELRLSPVDRTLEEMVVTPGKVSLLDGETDSEVLWTKDEVHRLPHLSDDLFRAVARMPGIAATDFSAEFHIRGGERNEVLYLIDGLRVYQPFHLQDFQNVFSIFDTHATGAVEVTTGGATAAYGDRMSGVVEIHSVVPTERKTMVGLSFEKAHFLSQGVTRSGGDWLASARRGYLDLILDAAQTEEDDFDLSPTYYDLFARFRMPVASDTFLRFHVLGASDDVEFSSDEDDDELVSAYESGYLWATIDRVVGPRTSLAGVTSLTRLETDRVGRSGSNHSDPNDRSGDDSTVISDRRTTDIGQIRFDLRHDPSPRHHLRAGLEARRLSADYDYSLSNLVTDPVFTDQPEQISREIEIRPEGWSYAGYASDRFRMHSRITLEAGLRWDRQTYVDDSQVSPRLHAVVQLGERTSLRGAVGRYFQSQSVDELQVEDGVVEFAPAQLNQQASLAVDHRLSKRSRLSLQLYSKSLRDPRPRFENLFEPLDIFPEGQSDRVLVAPDRGRSRGVELLFETRRRSLDWWVAYSLARAEDRIDENYVRRSWDQRHSLVYGVNFRAGSKWNINLAGVHHTGWPTADVDLVPGEGDAGPRLVPTARNSDELPSYHRIDVRASRRVAFRSGNELQLFVEITNLLDRDNVRSVSDFEVSQSPDGSFSVEREREKWLPRVPSFGVTWTF